MAQKKILSSDLAASLPTFVATVTDRQLPDKAVDVLDTACARVRISLAAAPEALERLRGEIAEGERQSEAMRRDLDAGLNIDGEALDTLESRLVAARA